MQGQVRPLRGFDRLAAAGFSEADIAGIRAQFHAESHAGLDFLPDSSSAPLSAAERASPLPAFLELTRAQWRSRTSDRPAEAGGLTATR